MALCKVPGILFSGSYFITSYNSQCIELATYNPAWVIMTLIAILGSKGCTVFLPPVEKVQCMREKETFKRCIAPKIILQARKRK